MVKQMCSVVLKQVKQNCFYHRTSQSLQYANGRVNFLKESKGIS